MGGRRTLACLGIACSAKIGRVFRGLVKPAWAIGRERSRSELRAYWSARSRRFMLLTLVVMGLLLSWAPQAMGQFPSFSNPSSRYEEPPKGVTRYGILEVAYVKSPIDGSDLFPIASPTVFDRSTIDPQHLPVELRAEAVEAKLNLAFYGPPGSDDLPNVQLPAAPPSDGPAVTSTLPSNPAQSNQTQTSTVQDALAPTAPNPNPPASIATPTPNNSESITNQTVANSNQANSSARDTVPADTTTPSTSSFQDIWNNPVGLLSNVQIDIAQLNGLTVLQLENPQVNRKLRLITITQTDLSYYETNEQTLA
ncbi:MAG: hypothetical protein AAGF24_04455, partial [Cyanobacteria bacterium P01_H01_bin.121]